LDAAFREQPGESLEAVVRRKLPLADDHLKWEVARIILALKIQATILKAGQEEVERYQMDVAKIHTFAPDAREGLLEVTERVSRSYDREIETMGKVIHAFDTFAETIKQRISRAETRRTVIAGVVDKFFESGS
jgi:sugar-specific transcriptional regulator TrmB